MLDSPNGVINCVDRLDFLSKNMDPSLVNAVVERLVTVVHSSAKNLSASIASSAVIAKIESIKNFIVAVLTIVEQDDKRIAAINGPLLVAKGRLTKSDEQVRVQMLIGACNLDGDVSLTRTKFAEVHAA